MIRHIVDRNQLLLLSGDDAGDVFLQFVVVFRLDEALPAFNGEHDVDVNLHVGVGHAQKMPLLTELENQFILVLQRCRAYGAWEGVRLDCFKPAERLPVQTSFHRWHRLRKAL